MAASLVLCFSLLIVQATDAYRTEIERYRSTRIQELAADDGWLTVAGLFWLKPGTNTVGGAPDNDIVLPLDGVARLGTFELTNGQVAFTAAARSPVTYGGTPVTTSAKFVVAAKSPLTERFCDALSSSRFAIEGKKTGFDALVVMGRAESPSNLLIDDGSIHLEPAGDLWGKTVPAATSELRDRFGPEWAFAVIGPAGVWI